MNEFNDEIDPEILEEFIKETGEDLEGLDPKFIELENNPDDSDVMNSIFRTVHSIKGASAFFNLNHMRNFAHKLENLLDELRKGERQVTASVIDVLLKGKDILSDMLDRLADGDTGSEFKPEEEAHLAVIEKTLASKDGAPLSPIGAIFEDISNVGKKLGDDGLEENSNVMNLFRLIDSLRQEVLSAEELENSEKPRLGDMIVNSGIASREDVDHALDKQKKLGEILVEEGVAKKEEIDSLVKNQRDEIVKKKKPARSAKKSMRIEEEKIDEFMDLVGELIINAEVFNYLQKKLEMGHELDKILLEFKNANVDFAELTFDLQRGLAEVRKVSINSIFQKFPRMVRDLAASTGKEVEFSMAGEDIMIDKSLSEQLESPLNHLIRNAADHGVETPDKRLAIGKPRAGSVKVTASESRGNLVITISDDGNGLDSEILKAKAVEKGIITQDVAQAMPDKDAHRLVFAPGFSTAKEITDVSGRGVGMDVVMTTISEAKGSVDIETIPGSGSTFILTVPMSTTLITISGLIVSVGVENYIIPMEWIKESLKPSSQQITSVKHRGELIEIRGELYPLTRLHKLFDVEPQFYDPTQGVVMLIEKDNKQCCLMVDEIIEETQVVLKDLGETFKNVKGIMGGAILGDGKVGLVIGVDGLLLASESVPENQTGSEELTGVTQPDSTRQPAGEL